ncbi:PHP domain-containing protein [Anopheles sinensis]|uniref:PHP domain-containing protein n=1 Tax=Anopheles sinensis TaxID=74873 RepID=A0A084WMM6_ANOSI|nr:PHP domain-containing protein [Anopheles sinensis]
MKEKCTPFLRNIFILFTCGKSCEVNRNKPNSEPPEVVFNPSNAGHRVAVFSSLVGVKNHPQQSTLHKDDTMGGLRIDRAGPMSREI